MVVKFFLGKHRRTAAKRSNKKISLGPLVGSKTDVREVEEDEDREDDNVSALELAMNHSDTVGQVDVRNSANSKKNHNFRLLPTMITRRKGTPPLNTIPDTRLRSIGEEKRDDCMDESILDHQSRDTTAGTGTINLDQQSNADSLRVESPLEVTITPEALSGLIFKRYSQTMKSSIGTKGTSGGLKVKGYIRVVGKAAGVKIVSGTAKIVKSHRLGTHTAQNPSPNHSTLIFSNESTGTKSTGSLRIRLPPPKKSSTTNGAANYEILTFEVGVLTPDGIFPLGTTTYQPLSKSSKLHHKDILKVDSIYKGSIFQRRKVVAVSPRSSLAATINDKDSYYRLQRRSTLSASFAIKSLSEKEYMASRQKQDTTRSTNKTAEVLPKPLSYQAVDSNQGLGNDDLPQDGTAQNEIRNLNSIPTGSLIVYLSDPLSCCSDRDVDSGDDEVIPNDLKTQLTDPSTDVLKYDEETQVALSTEYLDVEEPIQETNQRDRDINPIIDTQTENSGWCFLFPICCCVGTSNQSVNNDQNSADNSNIDSAATSALRNGISTSDTLVYDAVIQPKYLNDNIVPNEDEQKHDEAIYGSEIDEIIQSDSDMDVLQDRSVVGTRNCCMACFGDEDVEKLKYAKFTPIKELSQNVETTDEAIDELVKDTTQSVSNELNRGIPNEGTEDGQRTAKAYGGRVHMTENGNENDSSKNVDRNLAPRVDAVLDTMSSSYVDDDDEESVCSISFSEDLDIDDNVGCFQWMDAASSEGVVTDISMSVASSESQSESLEGIVLPVQMVAPDPARIPISKSEDLTTIPPTPYMSSKLQSNSIS